MPPLERTDLRQKATLWESGADTDQYGERIKGTPEEINVRWIDKRGDTVDDNGDTVSFDAIVITQREVREDSLLWLGTLEEWYGTGSDGSPGYSNQLMVVRSRGRTPDIKNRNTLYQLILVRYKENPNS